MGQVPAGNNNLWGPLISFGILCLFAQLNMFQKGETPKYILAATYKVRRASYLFEKSVFRTD